MQDSLSFYWCAYVPELIYYSKISLQVSYLLKMAAVYILPTNCPMLLLQPNLLK